MRLIIAFILPWLTFFLIGRPIAGVVCLVLQLTLIGWSPASQMARLSAAHSAIRRDF